MNEPTIYIDGQEGTTGLRIREMLAPRDDLHVLLIPAEQRKDPSARAEFLNRADLSVLCLPDDAAAEALAMIENPDTKVIDTSTVRRIDPDWVYGLPEISSEHKERICQARRVANCGCYPVSVILAVRPLIEQGLLSPGAPLTINAVSGYSGGGRLMVEDYTAAPEAKRKGDARHPLCLYGLDGGHKHVPEIWQFSLCEKQPIFVPSVDHSFCGMVVSMPVPAEFFVKRGIGAKQVYEVWWSYYRDTPLVRLVDPMDEALRDGKYLDLDALSYSNFVELSVWGDAERGLILVGRLDNLGKGASGNAVQCLNLMLGFDETAGLC
jgi:N-acetyl-gamma-glutamyl-phosphate reductase